MLIPKKILPNLTLLFSITLTSLLTLNSSYAQSTNSSLASNGCLNVVIANDFAYAACGQEIEVISLTTLERRLINVAADDISADAQAGLLFTQSGRNITMLSLSNPSQPSVITTATTNFSIFSGLSASSGVLAISGGAGSADTQIYTYTTNSLSLQTDGIPAIDSATGNPDVLLNQTPSGITAYYSQDIGGVANFAIQPVSLSNQGAVISIEDDVVLTPGRFDFSLDLGPSNFPVESEFLNGRLYVAHFAAQGIEVINTANNNQLEQVIPLDFVPTNIASDGALLFVVGSNNNSVVVIDPNTRTELTALESEQILDRPTGVAASNTHIAVADRTNGLVIISRTPVSEPNPEISTILPAIMFLLDEDK